VGCVPDLAAAMTGVHSHLDHLVSSGVGCGVRCKSRKVDCITVSSGRSFLLMEGMAIPQEVGWNRRLGGRAL
jgi:hypothetical protein